MTVRMTRRRFLGQCGKCAMVCAGPAFFHGGPAVETSLAATLKKGAVGRKPSPYFTVLGDRKIRCDLCPRYCEMGQGERGFCGVRENTGCRCDSLVYGNPCAVHVDPTEKKPLYHCFRHRNEIMVRHYSPKTLANYSMWLPRFQTFIRSKPPESATDEDYKAFLTLLTAKRKVSASTQNRAGAWEPAKNRIPGERGNGLRKTIFALRKAKNNFRAPGAGPCLFRFPCSQWEPAKRMLPHHCRKNNHIVSATLTILSPSRLT